MWLKKLDYDPITTLLESNNESIRYFTNKELLDRDMPKVDCLWNLDHAKKIIRKQMENSSWKYPGTGRLRSEENYNQIETFRQLGELVAKFGFNNKHDAIIKAAEYLFSFQTDEGDFRGIYGNQYSTSYTPAIMELLIKTGYVDDPRIENGFKWLLSHRQDDGGWIIPFRTLKMKYTDALKLSEPLQGDKTKPFSHLITGMVLRAFAAHPHYRKSQEAKKAGKLLMSRFFKRDKYTDRQDKDFWIKISYPFWFTDIVSSLDSLYFLGFKKDEHQIGIALEWLAKKQISDGTFDLKLLRIKDKDMKYWITLEVCRIFKRYYDL